MSQEKRDIRDVFPLCDDPMALKKAYDDFTVRMNNGLSTMNQEEDLEEKRLELEDLIAQRRKELQFYRNQIRSYKHAEQAVGTGLTLETLHGLLDDSVTVPAVFKALREYDEWLQESEKYHDDSRMKQARDKLHDCLGAESISMYD